MLRALVITSLLFGSIALSGCALFQRDPLPEVERKPGGRVSLVNSAEYYVVFESYFGFKTGALLVVRRGGVEVGKLQVTDIKQSPYYAADILQGDIQAGDFVENF